MWANNKPAGFTIVELLIVIVVIGILAAITIVAYSGIQQRANVARIQADLHGASSILNIKNVDDGRYPVTMPSETKTSPDIVMQLTDTGGNGSYCVNAYSTKDSTLRMSWDPARGGLQSWLCDGATIGSPSGGIVPTAARDQNLMPDFSRWKLSGGATYNSTTKELTLGITGFARSPIVRVDSPQVILVGADLYAANASPYSTIAPQAGYHTNITYLGSDGLTPVLNSTNYTGNGCARSFPTSSWSIADKQCRYYGGPNVVYSSFSFTGTNGGYASTDLKIKTPLMIVLN